MKLDRSYLAPVVVSLLVHVSLLVWMTLGWDRHPKTVTPPRANVVQAKLVELKPKTVQPVKQAQAPAKKIVKKTDVDLKRKEAERLKQAEIEKQKQLALKREAEKKAKADKAEKLRKEQEAEALRQQKLAEEQQRRQEQAFADALAEEQALLAEEQAEAQAQSYANVIKDQIERSWSRPPSARNGMSCLLSIQLIPSGEVVNVTVVRRSGNSAFDLSAEQAVRRAGKFEVVRKMEPAVFDQYFRQFTIEFKPEDLRL